VEAPKDPEKCNLFNIFKLFAPASRLAEVQDLYLNGGAAYGRIKLELVDLLGSFRRGEREEGDAGQGSGPGEGYPGTRATRPEPKLLTPLIW